MKEKEGRNNPKNIPVSYGKLRPRNSYFGKKKIVKMADLKSGSNPSAEVVGSEPAEQSILTEVSNAVLLTSFVREASHISISTDAAPLGNGVALSSAIPNQFGSIDTVIGKGEITVAQREEEKTSDSNKSDAMFEEQVKKREPQLIGEYIDFFYSGKIRALPPSVVQRLGGGPHNLVPERRSELQRKALATDLTLDRTRQLMQVARQARPNKSIESCLREFAADIASLHAVTKSCNIGRSFVFGSSEDGTPLADVWNALRLHEPEPKILKEKGDPVGWVDEAEAAKLPEAKSSLSKDSAKARRNVFVCAVIWRHGHGALSFSDTVRALRETTLQVKKKPENIEEELLDQLFSLSNSDSEKVGLYAEWANQSLLLQTRRTALLEHDVAGKVQEIENLLARSLEQIEISVQKEAEIEDLKEQLRLAKNEMSVQRVHARADFEALRAGCLGILKKDVTELENVEVALSRPIPKVEMAREVVDAVVDSLNRYIQNLEGQR